MSLTFWQGNMFVYAYDPTTRMSWQANEDGQLIIPMIHDGNHEADDAQHSDTWDVIVREAGLQEIEDPRLPLELRVEEGL